jgi:hypothetical protein
VSSGPPALDPGFARLPGVRGPGGVSRTLVFEEPTWPLKWRLFAWAVENIPVGVPPNNLIPDPTKTSIPDPTQTSIPEPTKTSIPVPKKPLAATQPIDKFPSKPDLRGVKQASSLRETQQLRWGAKLPASMAGFPGGKRPLDPQATTTTVHTHLSLCWVAVRGPRCRSRPSRGYAPRLRLSLTVPMPRPLIAG